MNHMTHMTSPALARLQASSVPSVLANSASAKGCGTCQLPSQVENLRIGRVHEQKWEKKHQDYTKICKDCTNTTIERRFKYYIKTI